MDTNIVRSTNDNDAQKMDISLPSTSSNCTFLTANDNLSIDSTKPKNVNNNIDLNALMHSIRSDDLNDSNESFDFNKLKGESYNFLDDPEYDVNPIIMSPATDSYDVNDILSSSSPSTHTTEEFNRFQNEPQSTMTTSDNNNVDQTANHINEHTKTTTEIKSVIDNLDGNLNTIDNSNLNSNDKYKYVSVQQMSEDEHEFSDDESQEEIDMQKIQSSIPTDFEIENEQQLSQVILDSIESEHNYSTKQKSSDSHNSFLDDTSCSGDSTVIFPTENDAIQRCSENIADTGQTSTENNLESNNVESNNLTSITNLKDGLVENQPTENENLNDNSKITSNVLASNRDAPPEVTLNDAVTNVTALNIANSNIDATNVAETHETPSNTNAPINSPVLNDMQQFDNDANENILMPLSNSRENDNILVNNELENDQLHQDKVGNDDEPSDLFSEQHSEPMEHRYTLSELNELPENVDMLLNDSFQNENIDDILNTAESSTKMLSPPNLQIANVVADNTIESTENQLHIQNETSTNEPRNQELCENPNEAPPSSPLNQELCEDTDQLPPKDVTSNDSVDSKLMENLLKFETFGENIKKYKEKLLTAITADNDNKMADCDEFASTIENEMKELLKDFRLLTCPYQPEISLSTKNDCKSAEDVYNLNQKSKERLLRSSSSSSSSSDRNDSDEDDSQQSKISKVRRRVKKRRLLDSSELEPSSQNTEDIVQGISKNTKRRIGSCDESDNNTDDSMKTQISLNSNIKSPSKNNSDDQELSTNNKNDDKDNQKLLNRTDSIDYSPMDTDDEFQSNTENVNNESTEQSEKPMDCDSQAINGDIPNEEDADIESVVQNDLPTEKINEMEENAHINSHDNDDATRQPTEETTDDGDEELNKNAESTTDETSIFKQPKLTQNDEQLDERESTASQTKSIASSIDELDLGEFLLSGRSSSIGSEDIIERQPQLHELLSSATDMPIDENLTQIMVKNEPIKESTNTIVNRNDNDNADHDVELVENEISENDIVTDQVVDVNPIHTLPTSSNHHAMYDDFESDFEGFTQREGIMSFEAEVKLESNPSNESLKNAQQQLTVKEIQNSDSKEDITTNDTNQSDTNVDDVKIENTLESSSQLANDLSEIENIVVEVDVNILQKSESSEDICMDSEALAAIEDFAHINTEDMLEEFKSYNVSDPDMMPKDDNSDKNDENNKNIEENDIGDSNVERTDQVTPLEDAKNDSVEINDQHDIDKDQAPTEIESDNDAAIEIENQTISNSNDDDNTDEEDKDSDDIDDLRDKEIDK